MECRDNREAGQRALTPAVQGPRLSSNLFDFQASWRQNSAHPGVSFSNIDRAEHPNSELGAAPDDEQTVRPKKGRVLRPGRHVQEKLDRQRSPVAEYIHQKRGVNATFFPPIPDASKDADSPKSEPKLHPSAAKSAVRNTPAVVPPLSFLDVAGPDHAQTFSEREHGRAARMGTSRVAISPSEQESVGTQQLVYLQNRWAHSLEELETDLGACGASPEERKDLDEGMENTPLGRARVARVTLACDTLQQLVPHMAGLGPSFDALVEETLGSVFQGYPEQSGASLRQRGAEIVPYFVVNQRLEKRAAGLEWTIRQWKSTERKEEDQARARIHVVDMWAAGWKRSLLIRAFHCWRHSVIRKKRQKSAFIALAGRWTSRAWSGLRRGTNVYSVTLRFWFTRWQDFHQLLKTHKSRKMLKKAQEERKETEERSSHLLTDAKRLEAELAVVNAECVELESLLPDLERKRDVHARTLRDHFSGHLLAQVTAQTLELSLLQLRAQLTALRDVAAFCAQHTDGLVLQDMTLLYFPNQPDAQVATAGADMTSGRGVGFPALERRRLLEVRQQIDVTREELDHIADEELLLRWVNYHVDAFERETGKARHARVAVDFGRSLCDCESLVKLLAHLYPQKNVMPILEHLAPEVRAGLFIAALQDVNPSAAAIVPASELARPMDGSSADMTATMLAVLCFSRPGMKFDHSSSEAARARGNQILDIVEQLHAESGKDEPTMLSRHRVEETLRQVHEQADCLALHLQVIQSLDGLWQRARVRLHAFAVHALSARARQEPLELVDLNLERIRGLFFQDVLLVPEMDQHSGTKQADTAKHQGTVDRSLSRLAYSDLLEHYKRPQQEAKYIAELLSDHFKELQSIFACYAAIDTSGGVEDASRMNFLEFWGFVRDCHIPSARLRAKILEQMFHSVARSHARRAVPGAAVGGVRTFVQPTAAYLTPALFVELLIRIAHFLNTHRKHSSTIEDMSLSTSLGVLLRTKVLPQAKKFESAEFKRQLKEQAVVAAFLKHRAVLEKLFLVYAHMQSLNESKEKWGQTIDLKEFVQCVRDAGLLSGALTMDMVYAIFANVESNVFPTLSSEQVEVSEQEEFFSAELIYPEFLEALAAVSAVYYPNPYTPLNEKVERLLVDVMVPFARKVDAGTLQGC